MYRYRAPRNRLMKKVMRLLFDARHWQERAQQAMEVAEEATTIAEGMRDPEAKRLMLGVAGDYMAQARHAESLAESACLLATGRRER
jgi:hypothetical protein